MWVYDLHTLQFLAVNEAAVALYGYTKEEFLSMTVADIRPQEDVAAFREHVAHSLSTLHIDGPWRHRAKSGAALHVKIASNFVEFEQKPARFVLIEDVTGTVKTEAALRQSELQFRQLADFVPHIIWRASENGLIEYVNQRWTELTDLALPLSTEQAWKRLLHPRDFERTWAEWTAAVSEKQQYGGEWRMWHRGRRGWEWFLCRAIPIRDYARDCVVWFGSFTGIHNQKETEAALRKVNEDLNQFAYAASHDLQEPLRNMSMFSQLLKRRCWAQLDQGGQEYVDLVIDNGRQMIEMIEDLRQYIHAIEGEAAQDLPLVDAETAFSRALRNLSSAIEASHAAISSSSLPSLRVRSVHLEQLFQNLLSNAIKYAKPDLPPHIEVHASPVNDSWEFSVCDDGIGIPPEYHNQVFQIFKRLDRSRLPGTGMGLAICRKIVERYGGRIWVESKPGQGSTFTFSIPVDTEGE